MLEPFTGVNAHGPDGSSGQIRVYLGCWDGDADALPCPEGIMFRFFDAEKTQWLTMCPWTAEVIALDEQMAPVPPPRPAAPSRRLGGARARLNVLGVHLYLEREDGRVLLGLRHPESTFTPLTWHFLAVTASWKAPAPAWSARPRRRPA